MRCPFVIAKRGLRLTNRSAAQALERSAVVGRKAAPFAPCLGVGSGHLSPRGEVLWSTAPHHTLLFISPALPPCSFPPSFSTNALIQTGPQSSSSGWQSCFLFWKLNTAQIWINYGISHQPQVHVLGTDRHLASPYWEAWPQYPHVMCARPWRLSCLCSCPYAPMALCPSTSQTSSQRPGC